MPYAEDFCGVYKIINTQSNLCYVGQSQRVKKRIADHFKLLRMNKHGNQRLQNAFNKYGDDALTVKVTASKKERLVRKILFG